MTAVRPVSFECEGSRLQGMLHVGDAQAGRGVLVVVGGPQYRIGSHRQFVLLARHLAAGGVPTLRFDYRGLGDSEGAARDFEAIEADIRCAIDAFCRELPSLRTVVIWGLCDAASAALMSAARDARVHGLVLLNPWVRSEQTLARSYLRHYYLRRLFDPGAWAQLLRSGRLRQALKSFRATAGSAMSGPASTPAPGADAARETRETTAQRARKPLAERMADGMARFTGRVLFIISGDDITAAEFRDATRASRRWRRLLGGERVSWQDLPAADHTFSRREWRDQVAASTLQWLRTW